MATEVGSLMRLLTRHDKDDGGSCGVGVGEGCDLVTRDLLGSCCGGDGSAVPPVGDEEGLRLELRSPSAWENRFGVMPEKACFQQSSGGGRPLQDLNIPPLCSSGLLPPPRSAALHRPVVLKEPSAPALDLKLRPLAASPAATRTEYQSVCTLEKVKSALERAQREPLRPPPPPPPTGSPASSSSTTTSSAKRRREAGQDEEAEGESKSSSSSSTSSVVVQGEDCGGGAAAMAAAGCPSCLLYVLICRSDPRCPRCNFSVPLPPPPPGSKKPRIDLNAAAAEPAAAASPIRTVNFF